MREVFRSVIPQGEDPLSPTAIAREGSTSIATILTSGTFPHDVLNTAAQIAIEHRDRLIEAGEPVAAGWYDAAANGRFEERVREHNQPVVSK